MYSSGILQSGDTEIDELDRINTAFILILVSTLSTARNYRGKLLYLSV